MTDIRKYITVGCLSLSIVGMELIWTRIFSAEFYYTFSFLILSFAILGLGMGSLSLRYLKKLNNVEYLSFYLGLAAIFSLVGPVGIFKLNIDFSSLFSSEMMVLKFLTAISLLFLSYFFGGLSLGLIFKKYHDEIPKLYMIDLIGAGLGIIGAVILMNQIGTQYATFVISLPLIVASFAAPGKKITVFVPIILFGLIIGNADDLLHSSRSERAPVIYEHWDAMSKIKMYGYGPEYRGLNIDNLANSPVIGFDGDLQNPMLSDYDIDVNNLITRFDSCTFLSLGAGGGMDVLQALGYGTSEIHAVEVNHHINKMMTEGDPSGYFIPDSIENKDDYEIITCNDFTGNIYNHENVKVISEDARTYIKQYKNKFDIIYSLSSNTWAALGSGSFAFAENYLYTTEAFIDYWNALSKAGFLSMEHQIYMPRLVSSVLSALETVGIEDPMKHFAVYDIPKMRRKLLLLSKQPLSDEVIHHAYGVLKTGKHNEKDILFPLEEESSNLYSNIIMNGWEQYADSVAINLEPATDTKPFIAQMGLWRNFSFDKIKKTNIMYDFTGFPLTKTLLAVITMMIILIAIPLCVIPYWFSKEKLKQSFWIYFFLLGLGYISIELILMQKYSLFIGTSFYSIATVLFSMLVASGIGSKYSLSVSNKTAFAGIVGFLLINIFSVNLLMETCISLPIFWRSTIVALIVFPLGFFMGMPFPKAGVKVKDLADWGFAVNGVASVLGSALVMFSVFSFGFNLSLGMASVFYIVAYFILESNPLSK